MEHERHVFKFAKLFRDLALHSPLLFSSLDTAPVDGASVTHALFLEGSTRASRRAHFKHMLDAVGLCDPARTSSCAYRVLASFVMDDETQRKLTKVFHTCVTTYRAHIDQRADIVGLQDAFLDVSLADATTIIRSLRFGKTHLSLDCFVAACEDDVTLANGLWTRFVNVERDLLLFVKMCLYDQHPAVDVMELASMRRAVTTILKMSGTLAPPGGEGI